ncbi:MAG TPA: energy transducer TonB [Gammaproteobacteria bacterium]
MTAGRAVFALLCALVSACASLPNTNSPSYKFDPHTDPYWQDPRWDLALLNAVQSAVHAPADPEDLSTPRLHGTVKFTFAEGDISYPEIVESTGDPDMDKLMLHQVVTVHPPKPTGPFAATAHEFAMPLGMPTPLESFEATVAEAIDRWKIYPKGAIMSGTMGSNVVGFDYLDGAASNVVLIESSKDRGLDKASLKAVSQAALPAAPPAYAGKLLHIQAGFCYSLETNGRPGIPCPKTPGIIQVNGVRISR